MYLRLKQKNVGEINSKIQRIWRKYAHINCLMEKNVRCKMYICGIASLF